MKTLMIVDDDSDDCVFFSKSVSEMDGNVQCVIAISGEDALMQLRKMNVLPDFIFLDLNMPRMDGRQCLAELKKDFKLKDIPVIIFTTSSAQRDIDDTKKLGAAYFLTKPFDFHLLHLKIQFIMERISHTTFIVME
ncbi:MAG: response regulator [Chryseolinea sp.]